MPSFSSLCYLIVGILFCADSERNVAVLLGRVREALGGEDIEVLDDATASLGGLNDGIDKALLGRIKRIGKLFDVVLFQLG